MSGFATNTGAVSDSAFEARVPRTSFPTRTGSWPPSCACERPAPMPCSPGSSASPEARSRGPPQRRGPYGPSTRSRPQPPDSAPRRKWPPTSTSTAASPRGRSNPHVDSLRALRCSYEGGHEGTRTKAVAGGTPRRLPGGWACQAVGRGRPRHRHPGRDILPRRLGGRVRRPPGTIRGTGLPHTDPPVHREETP